MTPPPEGQTPRPRQPLLTEWLKGVGESCDVVMSSRVRYARNLAGFPFVVKATRADRLQILDACRRHIQVCHLADQVMWVDLHTAPSTERTLLVERHLVSQQHARGKLSTGSGGPDEPRAVVFSHPDERFAIMINEEDHLRIQVIRSGLALSEALEETDAIDDKLESGLEFAYSQRFGYLTSCPTNVGTGARLSVMVHLPALRMTGDIDKVKQAAADMALAVRGFYGEGSHAAGDIYQISNQTTLGKTETVLLHDLQQEILPQVIEYERTSRAKLLKKRRAELEDQVWRAVGTLRHARLMTTEEAMQLLSLLRLGIVTGLVADLTLADVNALLLSIQPMHLQRVIGKELDQDKRRAARAEVLRDQLTRLRGNAG